MAKRASLPGWDSLVGATTLSGPSHTVAVALHTATPPAAVGPKFTMRFPERTRLDLIGIESRLNTELGRTTKRLTRSELILALVDLVATDPEVYAKTAQRLGGTTAGLLPGTAHGEAR